MKKLAEELRIIEHGIRSQFPNFADGLARIADQLRKARVSDRDRRHHARCYERAARGQCYRCGRTREDSTANLCDRCKRKQAASSKRWQAKQKLAKGRGA